MELTRRAKREPAKKSALAGKADSVKNAVKKRPKTSAGIAVGAVALIGAGFILPAFGTNTLSDSNDVSKWIHFESIEAVEGFSEPLPRTDYGSSPLATKQSVGAITKNDGKCSFNGQVSYLPSYNEGRGDQYLTENYLYTLGEGNMVAVKDTKTTKVKASTGKFEALEASYGFETVSVDPETEEESTSKKFRSVAVRAFDTLVDIEGIDAPEQGMYGSDPKKGLPVVLMTYECDTEEDYSDSDWKKMLNSVTVSLNAKAEPSFDESTSEENPEGLPERGVEPVIEDATGTIEPDREGGSEEPYVIPTEEQTDGPMEFVDPGADETGTSEEVTEPENPDLAVPPTE